MTRDEALKILNVTAAADKDTVEEAYRRLVRRYPPEFHPEKFRKVDRAYRLLTSVPYQVEHFLGSHTEQGEIDAEFFSLSPAPPSGEEIAEAMKAVKSELRMAHLWRRR